ncbi:MAG TPA: 1-(5-phosphoribosyl)-5-[(5-phosphoribosylamino)methylideneamino]imidazole-4-carboxamide isomerase [Tepidisphaeraceae bacterium]|jgi:phosphoribosylformimino-5-aminoimidazole carboxamide ribotide isomerase|nr:1-(5-phosphoribosyl)-5-[(5-phosphoribosylamino)methylideneamino]imidazole-4-carboxamide isomerase [Tepidisphaeraceae bacterium]
MALEIVPSIDLRDGKVVRLKQGDYSRQVNYEVDPMQTARSFADAGARWMHVVDLDGAKVGRPVQTDLIARIISTTSLRVEAGGGVRASDDVKRLLDAGAARVVVGTRAIEDWAWFDELVHRAELSGKLVLALDAKDGLIATRGWTQTSRLRAIDVAAKVTDWSLGAILYTDVSKDGMLQGPNFQATRELAEAGKVAVIASGGVGNIEHIRQLRQLPIWGAIVGRSLYEGTLDLREAIEVARG